MPQIAQQDYHVVKVTEALALDQDAATLAALLKAIQKGTIFDVIIEVGPEILSRVVAINGPEIGIASTSGVDTFVISYTATQYEGLAAIQAAALAEGKIGTGDMPTLHISGEPGAIQLGAGIVEDMDEYHYPLVDEEGHVYLVEENNSTIVSVSKSTILPDSSWDDGQLVVPFEDVQKLIGITAYEL